MSLISVIIPCHNQGRYLNECVDSVLAQTFRDFEIIVVNDGSDDEETVKVLAELQYPKTRVIHQENKGLSGARNFGISNASGEFILPLDADDKIKPDFLKKTVAVLRANPKLGVAYTWIEFFGEHSGVRRFGEYDFRDLLVKNFVIAAALFRKKCWEDVGGYGEDMIYGAEDWDFWISLGEKGWFGQLVPEPLFLYRQHKKSMLTGTRNKKDIILNQIYQNHKASYDKHKDYVESKRKKPLVSLENVLNNSLVFRKLRYSKFGCFLFSFFGK